MKRLELDELRAAIAAWSASAAMIASCGPATPPNAEDGSSTTTTATTGLATTAASTVDDGTTTAKLDLPNDTGFGPSCWLDDTCHSIDLLFVIDNSGTMLEEQHNVARNFSPLVDEIMYLADYDGNLINPNVNLMVTTTDMGHPLCTPFQKPDYEPRQGAPVYEGCNARIERFTGLDPMDPVMIEEACTDVCPVDVVPEDHFLHFSSAGSNVPDDDVRAALSCIGPQGIDGCGYGAPLEAMLRAIDPQACWNDPEQPSCDDEAEWASATQGFLRPNAALVIVLVTDGMDCSVAPDGYSFFTDVENSGYWNVDPALGVSQASPAICANAGTSCADDDGDGIYETCAAADGGALQPVERYVSYLRQLTEEQDKEVMMLGIFGVPEVLEHARDPPFQPTAGGVFDLVHRRWIDAPYPAGDILPAEWDAGRRAADEIFELGDIAPGCIGVDDMGVFIGQALPPVRTREVCESLNFIDEETGEEEVRCCIESICDTDFSPAIRCLTSLVADPVYED
jgi:hypothetical protein